MASEKSDTKASEQKEFAYSGADLFDVGKSIRGEYPKTNSGEWIHEAVTVPFETIQKVDREMKMQNARSRKGKAAKKPSIIAAPIAFTEEELRAYQYWCALSDTVGWLTNPPNDKEARQVVMDFMKIYAKIKAAMQAVEEGKKVVCIGRDPDGASDMLITNEWYTNAQGESDFLMSFFLGYMAHRCGSSIMKRMTEMCNKLDYKCKIERGRYVKEITEARGVIAELRDKVEALENKCKSLNHTMQLKVEDPLARSNGRLASKRPRRVKMTPIRMKGKKRSY